MSKSYSLILDSKKMNMIFVPSGFAHGFQTLLPDCEMLYLHTDYHNTELEKGYHYNSSDLKIPWPIEVTQISEKDKNLEIFKCERKKCSMKCRHCNNKLKYEFLDLGVSAPSIHLLKKENLNLPEKSFPLRVMVCDTCWLVQTEDFVNASEMFTHEYAYFSSYSSSFLNHTKEYVDKMVSKFSLDENSSVLEVASNDGYLLNFVKKLNIKCLGVEPTKYR